MIDLVRALRAHTSYGQRFLGFAPAFLVTELFYKFHSFALECVAFLITWLILDWIVDATMGKPKNKLVLDDPAPSKT